jgi:hypothetical protein
VVSAAYRNAPDVYDENGIPTSEGYDYLRATDRWPDRVRSPVPRRLDPGEYPWFCAWIASGGLPDDALRYRAAFLAICGVL